MSCGFIDWLPADRSGQTRQVFVSYAGMCAGQSDCKMKCLRLTSTFDETPAKIFFALTLDGDWDDSALVRAAVTCVCRQFNTVVSGFLVPNAHCTLRSLA